MTLAIETARNLSNLMANAAFGAPTSQSARECDLRSTRAAMVAAFLQGENFHGAPVTREEAQAAAKQAWSVDMPEEISAALNI